MTLESHKSIFGACFSHALECVLSANCIVYAATNKVNGKQYIGATQKGLDARAHRHLWLATKGQRSKFYTAIRKHGREAFEFKVLRECSDFFDALDHEARLIAELKPEYNLTAGGGGVKGLKFSDEAKSKMRAAKAGRPNHWSNGQMPAHIREKLADARRAERGRTLTEKQKTAMVQNAKTANEKRRKRILCLNDGMEYDSVTAAANAYGVTHGTILNIGSGKFKSRTGLLVKYI